MTRAFRSPYRRWILKANYLGKALSSLERELLDNSSHASLPVYIREGKKRLRNSENHIPEIKVSLKNLRFKQNIIEYFISPMPTNTSRDPKKITVDYN